MGKEINKLPPSDIDAESKVLGAILLEKDAIDEVVNFLDDSDFYDDKNQKIYKACVSLYKSSEPIDLTTVRARLKKLDLEIPVIYLAELTQQINSSANIEHHARIIAEHSMRRSLIIKSAEINQKSYDETNDIFDLVSNADNDITSIVDSKVRGSFQAIDKTMEGVLDRLYQSKDLDITGVPSGFKNLDEITGGFQSDELIIIAARPAMGKTAFVVSTMLNISKVFNKPVGMFSLEMGIDQINQRIISHETKIHLSKVAKPKLIENHEWDVLQLGIEKIKKYPVILDDTPSLSIIELRTKAKKMKKQYGIEMLIVDYLQLMNGEKTGNREQEISSISRTLKCVAKELKIPVIALSQLSRAVESRGGDKKPMLSDLRESGAIEQDADKVMFLYRPEYYGITETEDGIPLDGKGAVIVAKNRQGGLGEVYLNFEGKYTKWSDDSDFIESFPDQSSIDAFENERPF